LNVYITNTKSSQYVRFYKAESCQSDTFALSSYILDQHYWQAVQPDVQHQMCGLIWWQLRSPQAERSNLGDNLESCSIQNTHLKIMYEGGSKSFRSDQLFKVTNKTASLFFNIVSLYFNTYWYRYINLTIGGAIYPSQHFPFGAAFVCQAGNFWAHPHIWNRICPRPWVKFGQWNTQLGPWTDVFLNPNGLLIFVMDTGSILHVAGAAFCIHCVAKRTWHQTC